MKFNQPSGEAGIPESLTQAPTASDEIMTVEECATFTRTSVSYWRKKVAASALPVLRLGARTLLRKKDVLAYLESKVSPSEDEVRKRASSIASVTMLRKGAR